MREKTIKIYKFDELSDESKETAREWWRSGKNENPAFAEFVLEDAATIADIFGLDINQQTVKCMDGSTRYAPSVYYSGVGNGGGGTSFDGYYQYKKGCVAAVKEYAPLDTDLHEIVQALADIQKSNFYQILAKCYHSYSCNGDIGVDVDRADGWHLTSTAEEDITDALREFASWIHSRLEAEYEHTMSDENVDESIICNEYEFTEDGEIH